jgi:hypothetical protein
MKLLLCTVYDHITVISVVMRGDGNTPVADGGRVGKAKTESGKTDIKRYFATQSCFWLILSYSCSPTVSNVLTTTVVWSRACFLFSFMPLLQLEREAV